VNTLSPSPFAASLQFGFVMDWMYGDDTPRAEQRAALLSLDRSLLGEVMGEEAQDDLTLDAIGQIVAERRGTAEGRQARSVDDLANLLDRAGDLRYDELAARVAAADEGVRGSPLEELLSTRRTIAVPFRNPESVEWRFILTEAYGRYASAFGDAAMGRVRAFPAEPAAGKHNPADEETLVEFNAADIVPESLRKPVLTQAAARREVLARFLALSGPVTIQEIEARYGWDPRWVEERLTEWQRTGKLVSGKFRTEVASPEWCSRKVAEIARRRALASLRKQIEAVDLHVFAEFMQRWQHVDPRDRVSGAVGVATVMRQLYGLARPAVGWERDYLRSRIPDYDPLWLSQLAATGEMVWMAETTESVTGQGSRLLSRVRFFERGAGSLWVTPEDDDETIAATLGRLGGESRKILDFIQREGASFIGDIEQGTGLTAQAVRRGLRELASASFVTNDTIEALREVIRWRALPIPSQVDPTRWLPADYSPSPNRRVVQRRPNLRRLPKWKRPDRPGGMTGSWSGRWSLIRRLGTLGPSLSEEELAARICRQWLDRYGIVTRECWKRERPAAGWRSIYHELKKMEFRGEARRGYFVRGLAGAQFAAPAAIETLRATAAEDPSSAPFVVLAASDPANIYNLPIEAVRGDDLARPRGSGALIVTRAGKVAISVEGRGRRIAIASWMQREEVDEAKELLSRHLRGEKGARYLMLPDIRSS